MSAGPTTCGVDGGRSRSARQERGSSVAQTFFGRLVEGEGAGPGCFRGVMPLARRPTCNVLPSERRGLSGSLTSRLWAMALAVSSSFRSGRSLGGLRFDKGCSLGERSSSMAAQCFRGNVGDRREQSFLPVLRPGNDEASSIGSDGPCTPIMGGPSMIEQPSNRLKQ